VFNSVVLDPPRSPAILYTLHTPPKAIGELARDVGAGQLVLSHLSPVIEREHEAVGASIAQAYTGPVSYASDGAVLLPWRCGWGAIFTVKVTIPFLHFI